MIVATICSIITRRQTPLQIESTAMIFDKHDKANEQEFVQSDESGIEHAAEEAASELDSTILFGRVSDDTAASLDKTIDMVEASAGASTEASTLVEDAAVAAEGEAVPAETAPAETPTTDTAAFTQVIEPSPTEVMQPSIQETAVLGPEGASVDGASPFSQVPESAWEPQTPVVAANDVWANAESFTPKKKKTSVAKIVGVTLLVVVGLLAAIYGAGAFFFANHAYPNTTMGNEDVSMKSKEQIAEIVESVVNNYTVTTAGAGTHFAFSMKDAGVNVDGNLVASRALGMYSPWRWPLEIAKQHDVTESMTNSANASGLEELVRDTVNQYNEAGVDPVNASIVYDSDTRSYVIEPEKPGTKLDADKVLEAVDSAVATMSPTATLSEDDYQKAAITQEDPQLRAAAETASNYVRANIDLVLGTDATPAGTINGDQISQWVILTDGTNVGFNEEEMDKWLKEYADGLDTIGTERTYTRPDGAVFTVSGGTYGWEVDSQALVDQVREAIIGGQQVTITVPTFSEGAIYPAEKGQPDWGKYVDVSISEQYARCYDTSGNLIWESPVVTGSPDGKHDTPHGIYMLLNKEAPAVLKGEIQEATGQPEYETKVAYWMPFTYQGHGFHDATWQPDFGGSRFADGWGSHGCVNLPYDKAEQLFSLIDVGNAVIIHG